MLKEEEQNYYDKLSVEYIEKFLNKFELFSNIDTTNIDLAILKTMSNIDKKEIDDVNRRIYNKLYIEYLRKKQFDGHFKITRPNCYEFPLPDTDGSIIIDNKKIYVYNQINIVELIRNNVFLNIDANYLLELNKIKKDEFIETKYNLIYLNFRLEDLLLENNFIINDSLSKEIDELEIKETNKTIYNYFKKKYYELFFDINFNDLIQYDNKDFKGKFKKSALIAFELSVVYMNICKQKVDPEIIEDKLIYIDDLECASEKVNKKIKNIIK